MQSDHDQSMKSFEEFWPFYLSQHAHPLCRQLHFVGSSLAIGSIVTALATGQWWVMAAAPISGYAFAWVGHYIVEKNRPATFTHPLWSLRGDFVMWYKMLRGTLDEELRRYDITWPLREEPSLRAL
jgi:hypothetical protein